MKAYLESTDTTVTLSGATTLFTLPGQDYTDLVINLATDTATADLSRLSSMVIAKTQIKLAGLSGAYTTTTNADTGMVEVKNAAGLTVATLPVVESTTTVTNADGTTTTTTSVKTPVIQFNDKAAAVVVDTATGGATVEGGTAVVPTFTIAAGATQITEGNAITFTVTASSAPTADTTLTYQITGVASGVAKAASANDDLGKVTGQVTIKAGETTGTFTLTPPNEGTNEGFEAFNVSLLSDAFVAVSTTANVVIVDGPESGRTFSLTSSTDGVVVGTASTNSTNSDDTISGLIVNANAAPNSTGTTFQAGDNINAGSGSDTLNLTVSGTSSTTNNVAAVTLSNLEKIFVSNSAGETQGIDLLLADTSLTTLGLSTSHSTSGTGGVSFTNVGKIVDAELKNGASNFTVAYTTTTVAGTTDAQNLALSNQTGGTFTANGIETLNVTSSVLANSVSVVGAALTTVNATGDKGLTLSALPSTVKTLNASGLTAGGLAATISSTDITVTGSAGNDSFTLGSALTAGTVTAGDGTDTLVLTADAVVTDATAGARYVGFETLNVKHTETLSGTFTNRSVDTSLVSGVTKVGLNSYSLTGTTGNDTDTATSVGFTKLAATVTDLTISGLSYADGTDGNGDDVALTVSVARATDSTTDTLTVTLGTSTAAAGNVASGTDALTLDITAANEETLSILSQGADNVISTLTDEDLTSLTVTGSKALTISTIANATLLSKIDASAMTANFIISTINSSTTASTITSGSGNDSLLGSTKADSIDSGAGTDSINAGSGNDTISGGAGNDTLTGGTEADTFVIYDAADTDEITDWGVGNTLDVLSGSYTTAGTLKVTISDGATTNANAVLNLATVLGASAVASVTGGAGNDSITGGASADTITGAAGSDTIAAGAGNDSITGSTADGTDADSIDAGAGNDTIVYSTDAGLFTAGNAAIDTVVAGDGTDTLKFSATASTVTVAALDSWANITGLEKISSVANSSAVSITLGATAATAGVTTVDLSAVTASANVIDVSAFTSTTTGTTLTGGAGTTSITGGAGNDTITGGAASDSIVAGSGADSIVAGSGADTITGGAGADTITGGAGADIFTYSNLLVADSTGTTGDTITDFVTGLDKFQITLDYNGVSSAVDVNANVVATVADLSAKRGEVVYDSSTSKLYVNFNSDNLLTTQDLTVNASTVAASDLTFAITGTAAGDTIVGSSGADTITGGAGVDSITGGAGADNITIADAGDSDKVVLSSATTNGSDTITGFTATASADILYSRAYTFVAGTAADTALNAADTAACDAVSEFANNVVAVNATNGVAIATWLAAANAGDIDTTLFSRLLILDGGTGVDKVSLYYVENTTIADDASVSATLLGTFDDIAVITGGTTFVASNFDFIA